MFIKITPTLLKKGNVGVWFSGGLWFGVANAEEVELPFFNL